MRRQVAALLSAMALGAAFALGTPPATGEPGLDSVGEYVVSGPRTFADRNAVARTGAAIDYIEHGKLYIHATKSEVRQIQALGFKLEALPARRHRETLARLTSRPPTPAITTTPRW